MNDHHGARKESSATPPRTSRPILPIWPLGIALGLLVVVVVNFAFIYVATQNAPLVESSYETVDR